MSTLDTDGHFCVAMPGHRSRKIEVSPIKPQISMTIFVVEWNIASFHKIHERFVSEKREERLL